MRQHFVLFTPRMQVRNLNVNAALAKRIIKTQLLS
jgi:hypothetical protein